MNGSCVEARRGTTDKEPVSVLCRFRKQNELEDSFSSNACVQHLNGNTIRLVDSLIYPDIDTCPYGYTFSFDKVFPATSTQMDVVNEVSPGVLDSLLTGVDHTILAYGQTASGKTYSMIGESILDSARAIGLIPRIIAQIFESLNDKVAQADDTLNGYEIDITMVEVYLEKIYDLLSIANEESVLRVRHCREKGVHLVGARRVRVCSLNEFLNVIMQGQERRQTAATFLNPKSSRSHLVVFVDITQAHGVPETQFHRFVHSRLAFVDLAGSEKLDKANAKGQQLYEARNINKSLSALGAVIKQLNSNRDHNKHIPYRDSKLTRVLQDALGQTSRATFLLCCSESVFNYEETLSTLRFGKRMKQIKITLRAPQEKFEAGHLQSILRRAQEEIIRLKGELEKTIVLNSQTKVCVSTQTYENRSKPSENDFKQEFVEFRQEIRSENQSLREEILNSLKVMKSKHEGELVLETERGVDSISDACRNNEKKALCESLAKARKEHAGVKLKLEQRLKQTNRELVALSAKVSKQNDTEQQLAKRIEQSECDKLALKEELKAMQSKALACSEGDFRDVIIETLKKKISSLLLENEKLNKVSIIG